MGHISHGKVYVFSNECVLLFVIYFLGLDWRVPVFFLHPHIQYLLSNILAKA